MEFSKYLQNQLGKISFSSIYKTESAPSVPIAQKAVLAKKLLQYIVVQIVLVIQRYATIESKELFIDKRSHYYLAFDQKGLFQWVISQDSLDINNKMNNFV